jgi:hypothetical protein
MRQITFELLRHGPTNNQLLSPLTQYLALCENHAAVTVQVPFEHNQFLHRLRALAYQLGDDSREFQVKDTARVLGEMFGQVPGLIAELNRDPQDYGQTGGPVRREPQRFTHLRVISSASELALLPFELALTPNGFPGAGQSLLLQSQEPVCLTREVRRVAEQYLHWPKDPRVLFVAAAPADVGPIPMEAHLAVLQRVLEPWVGYADTEEERQRRMDEHLVVIKDASCQDVERACANGQFSHIHILAHGVQYADGYDVRFGLALHDPQNPSGNADKVSGERLATILRPAQAPAIGGLARPVAVTLASCDSAHVGTVAGMGASLAHALHAAGIPMVVASQFPISVAGSIVFVDVLYSGLLWGEDPRISLNDLRRRLHSRFPTTHDWASVTAYVALPPDFERQLSNIQIDQTMRSIEVALNYADRATAKLMTRESFRQVDSQAPILTGDQKAVLLERAKTRVDNARRRLEQLVERTKAQKARVFGLLAATEKRCAEVYFSFSRIGGPAPQGEKLTWPRLLQKSRQHYWESFLLDRDNSWAVVQYVSLGLLFQRWKGSNASLMIEPRDEHNNPEALWTLAHVLSINDLRTKEEQRIRWALGNLTELYLIALLFDKPPSGETGETLALHAKQRAEDLVDRAGANEFETYSTRRQILRYADWYCEIASIEQMAAAVETVLGVLPLPERHARE